MYSRSRDRALVLVAQTPVQPCDAYAGNRVRQPKTYRSTAHQGPTFLNAEPLYLTDLSFSTNTHLAVGLSVSDEVVHRAGRYSQLKLTHVTAESSVGDAQMLDICGSQPRKGCIIDLHCAGVAGFVRTFDAQESYHALEASARVNSPARWQNSEKAMAKKYYRGLWYYLTIHFVVRKSLIHANDSCTLFAFKSLAR